MTDEFGHDASCGCGEYRELSRRQFMGMGLGAMAFAAFPDWLPKVVLAPTYDGERDVIVSIFQRGGADGLNLIVPFGDPAYYTGRPTLAIAPPDATLPVTQKVTAVDNFFGFAPAMLPLLPAFQANQLLAVHAAGQSYVSRSHFDAQRFMEVGKPADTSVVSGWLGRHLATVPPMKPGAALRALGISNGLQKTLVGGPQTLPIASPANFTIGGSNSTAGARQAVLAADYADAPAPLDASALAAIDTIALLQSVNFAGYVPMNGATYPNTNFGRALKSVATLIRADLGVEAAQVDIGGWDTHSDQGANTGGMRNLMNDFSSSLGAFYADVVATGYPVTVVAISEFGRNVRENASGGNDHGRGTVMYAMGKGISGGRVLTKNWITGMLDRANLEAGQDLRVTVDYRDILSEIVQNRLGNPNLGVVFPGWTPTMLGVTR
jgi:uncharacterized protein (DUF1501 family)